jgi:hypothetical protein
MHERDVYIIFVRKPKGKKPLGRCGHMWEDNIKIGWEGVVWMHLAPDGDQ